VAQGEGQKQQPSAGGLSEDGESWFRGTRLDLFSERNEAATGEDFLGFGASDPVLLLTLGGISVIPLEEEFLQGKQPIPEPLCESELRHKE
jgi:hypothetical protein